MTVSLSQFFFFMTFIALFFLTTIFGEMPEIFILIGLFTFLFVIFHSEIDIHNQEKTNLWPITMLWIAWFAILIVSLFTTQSFPLTFTKTLFWLFSFGFFSFFSMVNKKWMSWELVKIGLLLSGSVLSVLSILTSISLNLRQHLPSQNMLVANYGHNHLGVFALFLLPICWEFWEKKRYRKIFSFLFVFFLVVIASSFGRVTATLALAEIIILFWKRKAFLSKTMKRAALVFILFSLVAVFVLSSFPVWKKLTKSTSCPVPQLKIQLCKSIQDEPRFYYWQEAIAGIKSKPITGWGAGTFYLVSSKFRPHSYLLSSYAHNQYLQSFVEYGLIGGAFFCVVSFVLFKRLFFTVIQSHAPSAPAFFLSLSLLTMMIDNFFDYDWEFSAILLLFLLGLAYFLFEVDSKEVQKGLSVTQRLIAKSLQWFAFGFIGVISLLYLVNQVFWFNQNYERALKTFPYVTWQVQEKIGTTDLKPETTEWLTKMYWSSSHVLRQLETRKKSLSEKQILLKQIVALESEQTNYKLLENIYLQSKWSEFNDEVSKVNQKERSEYFSDNEIDLLAAACVKAGNEAMQSKQYILAEKLYINAYRLQPNSFVYTDSVLLSNPYLYSLTMDDGFIDDWRIRDIGNYWPSLEYWYQSRMLQDLKSGNTTDLYLSVQKLIELDKANANDICLTLENAKYFAQAENDSERIITSLNCPR